MQKGVHRREQCLRTLGRRRRHTELPVSSRVSTKSPTLRSRIVFSPVGVLTRVSPVKQAGTPPALFHMMLVGV